MQQKSGKTLQRHKKLFINVQQGTDGQRESTHQSLWCYVGAGVPGMALLAAAAAAAAAAVEVVGEESTSSNVPLLMACCCCCWLFWLLLLGGLEAGRGAAA